MKIDAIQDAGIEYYYLMFVAVHSFNAADS